MRGKSFSTILAAVLVALLAACAPREEASEPAPAEEPAARAAAPEPAALEAHAELSPAAGGTANGWVAFSEQGGVVTVTAEVSGVDPAGNHGFHIHEVGDCSAEDFTSAGGHWNPGDVPHGGPSDAQRHAGDLGNIEIGADGSGTLELTSDLFTVAEGPNSVVGRGVILHASADDLVTQPTGAAGARLACGVVLEGPGGGAAEDGGYDEGDAN